MLLSDSIINSIYIDTGKMMRYASPCGDFIKLSCPEDPIWSYLENGFVTVTSFCPTNTKEENLTRLAQLRRDLSAVGFSIVELYGYYVDSSQQIREEVTEVVCPKYKDANSYEKLQNLAIDLNRKYGQTHFLLYQTGNQVKLYYCKRSKTAEFQVDELGNWVQGSFEILYSKVKQSTHKDVATYRVKGHIVPRNWREAALLDSCGFQWMRE